MGVTSVFLLPDPVKFVSMFDNKGITATFVLWYVTPDPPEVTPDYCNILEPRVILACLFANKIITASQGSGIYGLQLPDPDGNNPDFVLFNSLS